MKKLLVAVFVALLMVGCGVKTTIHSGNIALFLGAVIALVGIPILVFRYLAKKRSEALKVVADSLEFSFSREGPHFLVESLRPFDLFSKGRSRRILNAMNGRNNDIGVTIMDYRYKTRSSSSGNRRSGSQTWSQTVVLLDVDDLQLPTFVIRPENLFHKIGSTFGYQDIDFETHPTFSKRYLLRGPDEEAIRNAFTTEFLSSFERHKGLSMECDGNRIICYRPGKRIAPEKVRPFLEGAIENVRPFLNKS